MRRVHFILDQLAGDVGLPQRRLLILGAQDVGGGADEDQVAVVALIAAAGEQLQHQFGVVHQPGQKLIANLAAAQHFLHGALQPLDAGARRADDGARHPGDDGGVVQLQRSRPALQRVAVEHAQEADLMAVGLQHGGQAQRQVAAHRPAGQLVRPARLHRLDALPVFLRQLIQRFNDAVRVAQYRRLDGV